MDQRQIRWMMVKDAQRGQLAEHAKMTLATGFRNLPLLAEGNHVGEMGQNALKEVPVKGVATVMIGGERNILLLVETHHVGNPERHVLLAQLVKIAAMEAPGGQDASDLKFGTKKHASAFSNILVTSEINMECLHNSR